MYVRTIIPCLGTFEGGNRLFDWFFLIILQYWSSLSTEAICLYTHLTKYDFRIRRGSSKARLRTWNFMVSRVSWEKIRPQQVTILSFGTARSTGKLFTPANPPISPCFLMSPRSHWWEAFSQMVCLLHFLTRSRVKHHSCFSIFYILWANSSKLSWKECTFQSQIGEQIKVIENCRTIERIALMDVIFPVLSWRVKVR